VSKMWMLGVQNEENVFSVSLCLCG